MLFFLRKPLRLCRSRNVSRYKFYCTQNEQPKQTAYKDLEHLYNKYKDKITFSSYIDREKLEIGYFKYYVKSIKKAKEIADKDLERKSLPPLPIALQYYVSENRLLSEEKDIQEEIPETIFQLPFSKTTNVELDDKQQHNNIDKNIDQWMTNYEHYDDSKLNHESESHYEEHESDWGKQYGTPDPSVQISRVPCGGCGALLHCTEPSIPGYLPSEIFRDRTNDELKSIECQRCHFLKEYNVALDVRVEPEEYEKLLQSIKYKKSLVLLMVDLLDFPCSIWPGIVDIIGTDRPIIVVANKVDLIPGDSIGYLKRIHESLCAELNKTKIGKANIKHVSLISAKTGYGVEDLISAMFKVWLGKGDVFLVGCTNVGKSSLFNTLLQSDYCKVQAVDLIKRATVSKWPGTTLNLLKFPINRPTGWKIYQRTSRLKSELKLQKEENEIRNEQLQGRIHKQAPALIGHIGRTFSDPSNFVDVFQGDRQRMLLDENDQVFENSKWFYDTPGVVHPDQVLCHLTTEELLRTVPSKTIKPQTYYLNKGSSIFIAALARVDFLDCAYPCRFTIFCSSNLPITVTKTEDADVVYDEFLGTQLLGVPMYGEERLKNWPGLKRHENIFTFNGEGPKWCCGDIVLSSVAWVAVTAKKHSVCKVAAWTPEARGIYRRYPSLLPYSVNMKGKRIRDSPAYMTGRIFSEDEE